MNNDHVIPFIQYSLPYGKRTEQYAPMPEGWNERVQTFLEKSVNFSCEVLSNHMVALYAGLEGEDDFATVVCKNDSSIDLALIKLLQKVEKYLDEKEYKL